jgi:protease-4
VLASDLIWRAVCRLRERKPVVASLGDVAASGGYYVALGAAEILAEATTLTGSIGALLVGLDLERLLSQLGVTHDGLQRGRHAGIYSATRPRDPDELALLQGQVDHIYRGFVQKVAQSRGQSEAELEKAAQGRVWTGEAAVGLGLVDALGGLEAALERARARAGLGPEQGEVVVRAPRRGTLARLRSRDPLGAAGPGALLWCPLQIPLR